MGIAKTARLIPNLPANRLKYENDGYQYLTYKGDRIYKDNAVFTRLSEHGFSTTYLNTIGIAEKYVVVIFLPPTSASVS